LPGQILGTNAALVRDGDSREAVIRNPVQSAFG